VMRPGPGVWVDDQRWRGQELVGERPGAVLSSPITPRECRPGRTPGKATWIGPAARVPVQLPGVKGLPPVLTLRVPEPGKLGSGAGRNNRLRRDSSYDLAGGCRVTRAGRLNSS
jgi:hypothetical protein